MTTGIDTEAGQAVYSPLTLFFYDLWVLGFSCRALWRCPAPRMVALYDRLVSANHLDVGVGTGYVLDRCTFPTDEPRLALMDLNPSSLTAASRRVARYRPEVYQADVLEPLPGDIAPFDSAALSGLLHCLPGDMPHKARAFANVRPLLNPGARVFGGTLLGRGVRYGAAASRLRDLYESKGIFNVSGDDTEGLERALKAYFSQVSVEVVGCMALFEATA